MSFMEKKPAVVSGGLGGLGWKGAAVSGGVASECDKNRWLLSPVFPAPASDGASELLAGLWGIPLTVELRSASGELAFKIPGLNDCLPSFDFNVVRCVFFGLVSRPLGNGGN